MLSGRFARNRSKVKPQTSVKAESGRSYLFQNWTRRCFTPPLYEGIRYWERGADCLDLAVNCVEFGLISAVLERFDHKFRNARTFFLAKLAGSDSRCSKADA